MKRVYRFQVDLRAKTAQPQEKTYMDEESRRDLSFQARLEALSPARLGQQKWSDQLLASEMLMAYNASLRRAQSLTPGRYQENGIDVSVYFDAHALKHVVTQSEGRRVAHIVADDQGQLERWTLEAQNGSADLSYYLKHGIAELDDQELVRLPHFWLMVTRFERVEHELVSIQQWRRHYDGATDAVLERLDFSLG